MDSLRLARVVPFGTATPGSARAHVSVFRRAERVRFAASWGLSAKSGSAVLGRAARRETDGGSGASPSKDEFRVEQDEEQKSSGGGLVLGVGSRTSGSVVELNLIPQPRAGMFVVRLCT